MSMNRKPVILFVDDDASFSEVFTEVLKDEGYLCMPASSAMRMWAVLHSVTPDLIMLDYYIGSQNGVGLARQIRDEGAYKNVPIIFLTAAEEKPEGLEEIPKVIYMSKPFELNELLRQIRKTLNL